MSHLHHRVSALVDGELRRGARQRALAHVRGCAQCRRELEQTLAVKHRLLGLPPVEPSADLFTSLGVAPPGHFAGAAGRHRSRAWHRVRLGAGSMSAAVLAIAYAVGAPDGAAGPVVSPPVEEYAAEFAGSTGAAPLADPAVEAFSEIDEGFSLVSSVGAPRGRATYPPPTVTVDSTGDDPAAVRLLQRAVGAPDHVAYSGIRQVTSLDTGDSMRIEVRHAPGQGTSFEATDARDQTATFVAEETARNSGLDGEPLVLLVGAYDVAALGPTTVAGRPATAIGAYRDGQLVARFLVDDETGLLLRRELYDGDRLVRMTGFVSVATSGDGFLTHLPPELESPEDTAVSMQLAPVLNDDGWTCPDDLPGGFELTDLRRLDSGGDVVRATYSDGLSTISVFEQWGRLDAHPLDGVGLAGENRVRVRYGLPSVAMWESDGTVYTAVTDAPRSTVDRLVTTLPHEQPDTPGAISRVGDGLAMIGTAVNPLG